MISIFLSCMYIYKWEYRKPVLEVYFFSFKKGRSIFIRTPENKTILIGAGQNSEVIRKITKVTPFYKRKIDILFVTSASPVQIGGFLDIINRYEIDKIFIPRIIATSSVLTQLVKEIYKQKIQIEEIEKGDEVNIENDLKISVIFPYKGFKFNKTSLPELGLSIEYNKTSIFLFGNLSRTIQKDISKDIKINTDENIIEYYNNGSDSRVYKGLIEKINPKYFFKTKEKSTHFISDGEGWVKYEASW